MAAPSTTAAAGAVDSTVVNTPVMEAATIFTPFESSSSTSFAATTTTHVAVDKQPPPPNTGGMMTVVGHGDNDGNNTRARSNNNETRDNDTSSIDASDTAMETDNTSVPDFCIVPPNHGISATTITKNIASQAERLKDIALIESYILGVPLPIDRYTNSVKAAENNDTFCSMEILQEQLFHTNHTSDDERLLNQIMQSPKDISAMKDCSSLIHWGQALYERQATDGSSGSSTATIGSRGSFATLGHIQDQSTTISISKCPRFLSSVSLSRQSSNATMEILNNVLPVVDISHMNSTAWKPMFQQDHQEIPYSPAHIFEDNRQNVTTVPVTSARNIMHTTTSLLAASSPSSIAPLDAAANMNLPMTNNTTPPPQSTTIHTAGAQTLLLAAQVLHEETNHTKNHDTSSNKTRRKRCTNNNAVTITDTTSNVTMNNGGRGAATNSRIRANTLKNHDTASIDNDSQPNGNNVPAGQARVEGGRIAELIPDADITNNDVLLGRGGRTNHHIGNATYRTYKESLQEQYLDATKDGKTSISRRLVEMIHENRGRFVKAYEPTQTNTTGIVEFWYEVDLSTARKKASQALREINTPANRAAKRAKYNPGRI